VTVIPPDPGVVVIEVVRTATSPGVTETDVFRWIGVAVAVLGTVLATPDATASICRSVKSGSRNALASVRRLRRREVAADGTFVLPTVGMAGGRASAYTWTPWRPRARARVKIEILRQRVDLLQEEISNLERQIDRTGDDLRRELREAERRVVAQVQELAAEVRGERSRSSRVDARGFGPIALGIILTGLPGELAAVPDGWPGCVIVAVAVLWIVRVSPRWREDFTQALQNGEDQR
jgi:hypothetical protein